MGHAKGPPALTVGRFRSAAEDEARACGHTSVAGYDGAGRPPPGAAGSRAGRVVMWARFAGDASMTDSANRLHRWILLLTAGFLYAATALRTVLSFRDDAFLTDALLLLLLWLALFAVEGVLTVRWPSFFPLYMASQTAIVVVLLARTESGDFYAVLFGILSMQAMRRLGWRTALMWLGLFTPLIALPLTLTFGVAQALAFAGIYTAVDAFLAFFTWTTRRAEEARARTQALLVELVAANDEIETYSRSAERLSAAKERHRLARELHDSVTQTVFSMNLTAQSAALLLPRDRSAAGAQLERLEETALSSLAEIRALGSELGVAELDEGGLARAISRHLAERGLPDGLAVSLQVEGEAAPGSLTAAQELSLFRITQEALNNIVKHAGADEAAISLRLSPLCSLRVEDGGRGFDLEAGLGAGGLGLRGMRERAAEIGWDLRVDSAPGQGTRIVVEEPSGRVER